MSKKLWFVVLVAVALVLTLSACQKSASKAPVATPTTAGNLPFPTPLPDDALKNVLAATQTAVALAKPAGQATSVPATPTTAAQVQQPTAKPNAATATPAPAQPTATAKPAVIVPTATPGHPATYTLHQGEFPFCIARRYNVSISTLLSLNGLNINSRPAVGTVLKLPADTGWDTGARSLIAHPATYTVKDGDTIYSIACAYGDVDPNALIVANSLQSPYTLTAGQSLQVP